MASTVLANYSPEDVTILVAGFIPLTGYTNGSFVSITKDIMPFTSARTTDGRVARMYNNDQTYTVEITLHSASDSNDLLTKMWLLDEVTQRAKFPLLIKDQLGSSLFFSTTSWIESIPTMGFGDTIGDRVWTIRSSQAVVNVGGNTDPSSLLEDITNIAAGALPILGGLL